MQKINLLGIPVSCVTSGTVISDIEQLLKNNPQLFITTPNPEHIMLAQKNVAFKETLQKADLAIPDGIGVVWAVRKKIKGKIDRVTGVDLMLKICQWISINNKKWKVGLLGAGKGIAQEAARNLKKQLPNLEVVTFSDYKYGEKDTEIIQKINISGVNVLFVALGAPKQELFISKYLQTMSKVYLAMGVGGAFDILANKLKRPPKWIQNLGLEWLFRLIQEPWRWKRQLSWIEFALRIFIFGQR